MPRRPTIVCEWWSGVATLLFRPYDYDLIIDSHGIELAKRRPVATLSSFLSPPDGVQCHLRVKHLLLSTVQDNLPQVSNTGTRTNFA